MSIHSADAFIILLYFGILIGIGFYHSKGSRKNQAEYILAGRRLSLPGFVATLVATWYGGILGIGENTYNYGVQTWVIFGLPYYIFAAVFALIIAGKIRQLEFISIPDQITRRFGKYPGIFSAVFLLFLASPAPYILSIGILLQFLFGLSFGWALLTATTISLVYIWHGGFGAVVRTDILQFILMFSGFIMLLIFAWIKIGSPVYLMQNLPETHLSPTGGQSRQFIAVWFFIALWTFVDPGFYQRCAAASNSRIARKGILISIAFLFGFDMLTLFCGLYARVVVDGNNALFSFPLLGQQLLPPLFYGLFLTGIISTIMSTIDSFGLISAVTFGRDILWRLNNRNDPTRLTQIGLPVMAAIALFLAWKFPSVVGLWYVLGSVIVPGLLLPFLLSFTNRQYHSYQIIILMIIPVLTTSIWFWVGSNGNAYPLNLEPFIPGLLLSIIISIFIKPKTVTR